MSVLLHRLARSTYKQHPREYSGSHWCVLVSKTTPTPQPGSDEINRAYEEGWVGNHALAFIGDTLSPKGEKVPELFIVELPQDEAGWKVAGDAPLKWNGNNPARATAWCRAATFNLYAPSGFSGISQRPAPLGAL